jgi:uncharacterized protein
MNEAFQHLFVRILWNPEDPKFDSWWGDFLIMKKMPIPYLPIILGIIIFILAFSLLTFFLYIHPIKYSTPGNPKTYGLDYEKVEFQTQDGLTLRGWFIPSNHSNATIIVGHGFPFDKANIFPATKFLNKHYNLFYYDFRYFGESDGKITTIGWKEQQDMLDAISYLKTRKDVNKNKIGVLGFSLSAAVPLMLKTNDIKAIVADSSYASLYKAIQRAYFIFPWVSKYPFVWTTSLYSKLFLNINIFKISPEESVKNLETPIFFIHGDKDSQIPVEHSKALHENAPNSNLWIVEGAVHGMSFSINKKQYETRVLEFFDKHLL